MLFNIYIHLFVNIYIYLFKEYIYKVMKIYTKTGDTGKTSLFNGDRVSKSDLRVDAYGTLDELSALLGVAIANGIDSKLETEIGNLQQFLFSVCADLATPLNSDPHKESKIKRVSADDVTALEHLADELSESLPAQHSFIISGGNPAAAVLHVARTVCRRAERIICHPELLPQLNPELVKYVNRLSDLLFIMARYENFSAKHPETEWKPVK